jgi:hypothetical protein
MSERLRRYNPEEDEGIILDIKPTASKGARFTESVIEDAEWEPWDDSKQGLRLLPNFSATEQMSETVEHIDPFTLEGLAETKAVVTDWFRQVNDRRMSLEQERGYQDKKTEEFYQNIRLQLAVVNEYIRELKDLTESEDDELVEAKVASFTKSFTLLQDMVELFIEEDVSGEEHEPESLHENIAESEDAKVSPSAKVIVTARGPLPGIGRKPRIYIDPNHKDLTKEGPVKNYGQEEVEAYVYRAQLLKEDFQSLYVSLNQDLLSEEDKKDWKFCNDTYLELESIIAAAEKEVIESGKISNETKESFDGHYAMLLKAVEHYKKLEESRLSPQEQDETTTAGEPEVLVAEEGVGQSDTAAESATDDKTPEVASPEEAYQEMRTAWLEAKNLHETKHAEYQKAVADHYASLGDQNILSKTWTNVRASFGFKPQLSSEVESLREEMFAATAAYNTLAIKMLEDRSVVDKKITGVVSGRVLDRYQRMLARTTLLNTFKAEQELQTSAAADLGIKVPDFIKDNRRKISIGTAVLIGGATGGVLGAGSGLVRAVAGGALAGAATGVVGKVMDARVDNALEDAEVDYKEAVGQIEKLLQEGDVSASELEDSYSYLKSIYTKVDSATQQKIIAILGTSVLLSAMLGASVAEAAEGIGAAVDAVPPDVSGATESVGASFGVEGSESEPSQPEPQPSPAEATGEAATAETPEATIAAAFNEEGVGTQTEIASDNQYTLKSDDNLWDILEGQTEAGEFKALEGLSEAEKQQAIAAVAATLNESAELREQFNMGDTADMVYAGETLDTEALNTLVAETLAETEVNTEVALPEGDTSSGEVTVDPGEAAAETVPATAETAAQNDVGSSETVPVTAQRVETANLSQFERVSQETVDTYARNYTGGFNKFHQDFETNFVAGIQGPVQGGGLFDLIFGSRETSADAFKVFGPYTVAEFKELATLEPEVLTQEFAENNIDMDDYRAWCDALQTWEQSGLRVSPQDRFDHVAETAFIRSLEQAKTT